MLTLKQQVQARNVSSVCNQIIDKMDFKLFLKEPDKKVKSLVRKLTHSGETDQLDRELLNELKSICKGVGDDKSIVIAIFRECLSSLQKEHSQIRVATVKLIDYLFQKSHIFREKLLENFDLFSELTLAISGKLNLNKKLSLPPPKKYAALLQELTAKFIHCWHSEFGRGYERLRYAYKYLQEHQLVDFSQFRVNTHEGIIKRQKLLEDQERILSRSIENKLKELDLVRPDIEEILVQAQSLIELIVPDDSDTNDLNINANEPDTRSDESRQQIHGIANLTQRINLEFSPFYELHKSDANKDIVKNLKELKKQLIEAKLPKLISIEKTLIKRSEMFVDNLKTIIDLKSKCTDLILKLGELKIVNELENSNKRHVSTLDTFGSDSDDDDESDFEEVQPKEGLETYIPKSMRLEYGLEPMKSANKTSVKLVDESFVSEPSCSGSGPSLALTCNVKLDSGKLCNRRDKVKCPFHGKIIPRDHNGIPIDEVKRLEEERERNRKPVVPEWQDPQLLAEIKSATGVDLTMPKKGRKTKQPRLADAKTCDLTPQQRLQKRLKALNK